MKPLQYNILCQAQTQALCKAFYQLQITVLKVVFNLGNIAILFAMSDAQAEARAGGDGDREWLKLTVNVLNKDQQPSSKASRDLFEDDFKDTG